MSLETKLMTDLKEAMKAKDQVALRAIRALKAAILLFKTDGTNAVLDASAEIKMVQKLVKQRQDSLDIFVAQNREDLAEVERGEMEILKRYLPEQLDENKLKEIIGEIVAKTGASSMKDMGKVMGMASKQLAGKADGKTISSIVKGLLS